MVTDDALETFADAVVAVVVELLLLLRLSTKLCIDIDDSSFEWSLELLSVRFLLLVDKTLLLLTVVKVWIPDRPPPKLNVNPVFVSARRKILLRPSVLPLD